MKRDGGKDRRMKNSVTIRIGRPSAVTRVVLIAATLASLGCCGESQKAATDAPEVVAASGEIPRELTLDFADGVKMETVLVPAGTFTMGSGRGPFESERPAHQVTISRPFYLGKYPVTQEQWQAIVGTNPSRFKGAKRPVEGVSWKDAQEFCRAVSAKVGKTVRLPTEAEWEFACRAGTTTDYSFGDREAALVEYAWCEVNSGGATHAVGQKKPNAWGLYDMHGNVWEWCRDWYDPKYYASSPRVDPQGPARSGLGAHVLRGGAWHVEASYCRSAARGGDFPCGEGGPGSWNDAGRGGLRIVVRASEAP
jgi:formylglycine-generating enzyme required for sulfatase activity